MKINYKQKNAFFHNKLLNKYRKQKLGNINQMKADVYSPKGPNFDAPLNKAIVQLHLIQDLFLKRMDRTKDGEALGGKN